MSSSKYSTVPGLLLAASFMATGAVYAADTTEPAPHPLPKSHDMTAGEAARYVQQRATGVCEFNRQADVVALVRFTGDGRKVTDYQTTPRETPDPGHAESIFLGHRLQRVDATDPGRLRLSTLFVHTETDRQNCRLMLVPEGGGVPQTSIYVLRDGSDLNRRKASPLTAPLVE